MRTGTVALTWHQTLLFLSPNRRTLYVRYLFESMLIIFFKSFHLVKVVFSLQFCSSFQLLPSKQFHCFVLTGYVLLGVDSRLPSQKETMPVCTQLVTIVMPGLDQGTL